MGSTPARTLLRELLSRAKIRSGGGVVTVNRVFSASFEADRVKKLGQTGALVKHRRVGSLGLERRDRAPCSSHRHLFYAACGLWSRWMTSLVTWRRNQRCPRGGVG